MTNDARDLVYHCPECEAVVVMPNKIALGLVKAAGACHLCRLEKTVEHLISTGDTELLADVLRFTEDYKGFRIPQYSVHKELWIWPA